MAIILNSGCALAPFNSPKSARSLGEGNNEIDWGLLSVPHFQYTRGVTENLDVGASIGIQFGYDLHAFARYSFVNREEGHSFGAVAGAGAGVFILPTTFAYLGPSWSFKDRSWEFFAHPRLNLVAWDETELRSEKEKINQEEGADSEEGEDLLLELDGGQLVYAQLNGGFNYWFTDGFALSVSGLVLLSGQDGIMSQPLPEFSLLWHF